MKLPQLSLRELFLLVALVAMGCGWWVDRYKIRAREDATKERESQLDYVFEQQLMRSHLLQEATLLINKERAALGQPPVLPTIPPTHP